ncbi:hypothetical protein PVA38_11115 [Streptococcus pneumoniae D39]|nr:hypothetical protein PVA38_11115 [Streptococcus pneumoniae D39]
MTALSCLLYTSDAADDARSVDVGGRRIFYKKNEAISPNTFVNSLYFLLYPLYYVFSHYNCIFCKTSIFGRVRGGWWSGWVRYWR